MTRGADLTTGQVAHAIDYNSQRFSRAFMLQIQIQLNLPSARQTGFTGRVDEAFVRGVADWQEAHTGSGSGDGVVNPRTEAHIGLLLPEARLAVQTAERMLHHNGIDRGQEGYLYDGWSNDFRDNNLNRRRDAPGVLAPSASTPSGWTLRHGTLHGNDPSEDVADNIHNRGTYSRFRVVNGSYAGGWPGHVGTFSVGRDATIQGRFVYRNCADIVSEAYRAAGVMDHLRCTADIKHAFERKGWVWRRSLGFPDRYLPGDLMCIVVDSDPRNLHGHAAIVVAEGPTGGGRLPPEVIELPGPTSAISDNDYQPGQRNDLRRHRWPLFRMKVSDRFQFLGRLLRSRLHGHP